MPRLISAYFDGKPDPENPAQRVTFGTSGHRGSSFVCSFNENHILAITQSICLYRQQYGIDGPLFLGIDTHALSAKANADFSVLQCWGRYANKAYLIDQIRGRWEAPELLKNAEIFYRKHSANESSVRRFIIEEAAAGPGLIQSLRRMGIPVHPIKPIKDKVQRVQDILTWITNGFVMIPRDTIAPWVRDFKTECAQFRQDGKSPHDDQVDCLAYGVAETLGRNLSSFDVLTDSQHRE